MPFPSPKAPFKVTSICTNETMDQGKKAHCSMPGDPLLLHTKREDPRGYTDKPGSWERSLISA